MQDDEQLLKAIADPARRIFFKNLGKLGLGAAAAGMAMESLPRLQAQTAAGAQDTANQIFTAALVAEDLATTFYYNGLIGGVIQDPALAGVGGTALLPGSASNVQNVNFLRAALSQEITHANLLRMMANLGVNATTDPYQTFYFPANTFATLGAFSSALATLETILTGAYLVAVREFTSLAAQAGSTPAGPDGGPYSALQLQYFAQVAASIMGVEAEHRVLAGILGGQAQLNDLNYEQTDGLLSVANGPNSVMAALMPFLTPATGPAYSLAGALAEATDLGLTSFGAPPSPAQAMLTASPNPIPVKAGQDGVTTISWNAPSASIIQVRVNSPGGGLLTDNINKGSMTTGTWVTNGMTFYLQDASNGNPTAASSTLASITVTLAAS